jgi:hypothetical protein
LRYFLLLGAQVNTQKYGFRPYGVGLLVAGFDVKIHSTLLKLKTNRKLARIYLNAHHLVTFSITTPFLSGQDRSPLKLILKNILRVLLIVKIRKPHRTS